MFGINRQARGVAMLDKKLAAVLSRAQPIEALDVLANSLGTPKIPDDLNDSVIALDSSVFLKLASSDRSADVVDYLNTQHQAGIILPGQSIQEFWNNRYNAVPSLAKHLRSSFDTFSEKIKELDEDFGDFRERFDELIKEFENDHGHIFEEATVSRTFKMLEALKAKACVPFVNRTEFQHFALHRQNTKTPPGFRDGHGNDGDFFVWLDTLRGVQTITKSGARPKWLVFVTNDKKVDWSRDGTPHPVLTAELAAACNVELCILDLNKFLSLVDRTTK